MVILKKADKDEKVSIHGHTIALSNRDKVFWPEEGYTKGDVFKYYHEVSKVILPYLKNRPMVLRRNPEGIRKEGFFQKDTSDLHLPAWIKTIKIQHETSLVRYLIIQDEAALMYVVNLGCIELNPFHSRINHLEYPDYLIWDLDPEDIAFDYVIEVAHTIHEILSDINVECYCKTSGGRGLHVYVPLGAKYSYEQTKTFAELIATITHEKLPQITSLERMPAKRQKKVYIDTLQNEHTKTVAAPYCLRPKPHAPVSTPLKWSELKPGLKPEKFTINSVIDHLKKVHDLFKPVLGRGIDLKKCLKSLESQISS